MSETSGAQSSSVKDGAKKKKNDAQEKKRRIIKEENKKLKEDEKRKLIAQKEEEDKKKQEDFRQQHRQKQLEKITEINQKRNKAITKQLRPVFQNIKGIHLMQKKLQKENQNDDLLKFFQTNIKLFEEGANMERNAIQKVFDTIANQDYEHLHDAVMDDEDDEEAEQEQ